MTSKEIYKMVSDAVGFNISKSNRKREIVYAQSIANKLSRKFTNESYEKIGKNCNKDHTTVLLNIRKFDSTYKFYTSPINVLTIYNKVYKICQMKSDIEDDDLIESNIEDIIQENVVLKHRLFDEKQKRIDVEYNFRKEKHRISKSKHPLLPLLHNIPEEHIESVKVKLDAIIKCLPKKNLPNKINANY